MEIGRERVVQALHLLDRRHRVRVGLGSELEIVLLTAEEANLLKWAVEDLMQAAAEEKDENEW